MGFKYRIDGNGVILTHENTEKRGLFTRRINVQTPTDMWMGFAGDSSLSALTRIEIALSDTPEDVIALDNDYGYRLSHDFVAALTDAQALALGLPNAVPYNVRLDSTGPLFDSDARINMRWLGRAGRQVSVSINGAFAEVGEETYRLPGHVYNLIPIIKAFNAPSELDERLGNAGAVLDAIESFTGSRPSMDRQLSQMTLIHATSMSVNPVVQAGSVMFEPMLYTADMAMEANDARRTVAFKDSLLTPVQQEVFARSFAEKSSVKRTYLLADGSFVFLDPDIRTTASVIKEINASDAETRMRFGKSPSAFLRQRFEEEGVEEEAIDEILAASFVENDNFSDRVREIGIWQPPALSFIKKARRDWTSLEFELKIGDQVVKIPEARLEEFSQKVEEAVNSGQSSVSFEEHSSIPVSDDTVQAIRTLRESARELSGLTRDDGSDSPEVEEILKANPRLSLLVDENYDGETFNAVVTPRTKFSPGQLPSCLINQPKSHQIIGIEWLQKLWCDGYPGGLLADDMGVGKTFQTLSFVAWLQEQRRKLDRPAQPIMIVAPKTLLGTWQQEAELHLESSALGRMELLYGANIKACQKHGYKGRDIVVGQSTLDVERLSAADWILTTYETLSGYQFSLAALSLSCVIFDEMQKIKNLTSSMTNAAKAINADFSLGLTGTPVENSLQDLWVLLDTLMPGVHGLGDLKSFVREYAPEDHEKMSSLHDHLLNPPHNPAPILRRLKSDIAVDLPNKHEHFVNEPMGDLQAQKYDNAREILANSEDRTKKLAAFHSMKSISLHPAHPDSESAQNAEAYIQESGRLRALVRVLDDVHCAGDKALVFVTDVAMGQWLAGYISYRYKMGRLPGRIYGETKMVDRQLIVEQFQSVSNKGFDVLLLSPKAAGFGITLTAANHVIHLERWWNPAVEDQCTDRAYRIGQKRDVHVYYLRTVHPLYDKGSFDIGLHDLLAEKRSLSRQVLMPNELNSDVDHLFDKLMGESGREL